MSKREARLEGIRARAALSAAQREAFSRRACEHIRSLPEFKNAKSIFIYRAVGTEIDPGFLDPSPGKTFLYPLIISPGCMEACEATGGWRRGAYGIPEPDPEFCRRASPDEIDLVICPCAAFDSSGARLGMGGGFYDRFLTQLTHAKVLCAAFEVQRLTKVPTEPHDFRMDAVVTELGYNK